MKIVGKNSVSKYLSYLFFVGFLFFLFCCVYFIFGYIICYLNYDKELNFFTDNFFIKKKEFSDGIFDFFTINFPFTKTTFLNAEFCSRSFIGFSIGFSYLSIFFYSSFRIMKCLNSEKIFTVHIIKWTKIFTLINFVFLVLFISLWYFIWRLANKVELFLYVFAIGFLIIVCLFVIEFFKKGRVIETENDLTI